MATPLLVGEHARLAAKHVCERGAVAVELVLLAATVWLLLLLLLLLLLPLAAASWFGADGSGGCCLSAPLLLASTKVGGDVSKAGIRLAVGAVAQ